ncbi:low temperature requirement protein A [Micromonospora parathelypteridis]|uniref:Low temperature requirement protein LtrA n=1 Tax=Micromonospora parathelypteridis TaxID=1839617 RepID=A0A840W6F6_9ACTN|nr:low temperature requirement protein A [Micromonospora parathelypteridis]MBB5481604.1 low temperature requirement protein LtrA [Micromonospora parathelypteridis]GGO29063.1 membrane protein [Micromonospora parathelypteridis]
MTPSEPPAADPVRPQLLRPRQGVQPTTSTELFFDLVFIFTITQLSHYLIAHPDWRGAARTGLLLALVWFVWIYTTWLTNWLQPDQGPVRAMLIAVALGSLLLSAAIPEAFGSTGLLFALVYVTVQVGRTLFALWAVQGSPWLVAGFQQSLPWITGTSVLVVLGGLVDGAARGAVWTAVIVIEVVGLSIGYPLPRRGRSRPERWMVEGGHLSERSAAFVLIALGESILVTGSTLTSHVDLVTSGAFLLAFAGSVALWWVYFARSAPAATEVIAQAGERTGALSRVAFNYLHPVIVAGVIVTSASDERLLREPGAPATAVAALLTLGGPALFLAGHAAYKALLWRILPISRIVAVVVLLALIPVCVGLEVPVAACAAVALAVTVAVIVTDRFRAAAATPQSRGPRSPLR